MKAQISFVEFLTAITIFIGSAAYISFQVSSFIPNYLNEVKSQRFRLEALQLSELLINNPGYPEDWYRINFDEVKRLGLSDEEKSKTNLLSGVKLSSFFSNCTVNPAKIGEKLDIDYNLLISFKDMSGSVRTCLILQTQPRRPINITIARIVAYNEGGNTKYGELILQVW